MLKYLFTATYADGTVIQQTQEDVSPVDPKKSQFYDVMQYSEKSQLVSFILTGDGHEFGVDLTDGHFEIDGVQFMMHEEELAGLEVIFFRQHTHSFNVKVSDGSQTAVGHDIVYRLGWKQTGNQQNQRVMQIT